MGPILGPWPGGHFGPPGGAPGGPRAGGPRARKFPPGAPRGAPGRGAPDGGPGGYPLALGHGDGPSLIGWSGSTGPSPMSADGDTISTDPIGDADAPVTIGDSDSECCPESSGRVAFGYRKRPTSLGRVPSHWDLTVLRWGDGLGAVTQMSPCGVFRYCAETRRLTCGGVAPRTWSCVTRSKSSWLRQAGPLPLRC